MTLAELPDEIRGYEHIKLESVARFRETAKQLIAQDSTEREGTQR